MSVPPRLAPLLVGVATLSALADTPPARAEATGIEAVIAGNRPLYTCTEGEVDQLLRRLERIEPDPARRAVWLGRRNIGQPYEIYLLGEYPLEVLDPDPLYCLQRSDCVTFCEHMFAMALSSNWTDFLRNLQRIRYRDGVVGMLTRNHYTVADWDRNNAFLFNDLTGQLGEGNVAVPFNQVCRRARFFAKFGIGQDIPDQPVKDRYIPKERVAEVLTELRDGDFVNIIRGDAQAQWAGHTGLIALGPDGSVNFLHSARPAVREQPLVEYLAHDRRCVGVKFLRLHGNPQVRLRQLRPGFEGGTDLDLATLNQAVAQRRAEAPLAARPVKLNFMQASRLQAYRIAPDTPVDAALQAALDRIDTQVTTELGITPDQRSFGILDLNDLRLAVLRPDDMFYAASVMKLGILLAYFETHPEQADDLPPEVAEELERMIKVSDNATAGKYGAMLGIERIQEVLQARRYRFYNEDQGGLWYGKHYGKTEPRVGDPRHDHSHAVTVRQMLRFYLMMEQGRLVSYEASQRMRQVCAAPSLEHTNSKFVAGLQGRNLCLIRKSGTWEDWHLDTARVEHGDHVYLLVGMAHHPRGAEYLQSMAAAVDEYLCGPPDTRPLIHQRFAFDNNARLNEGTMQRGKLDRRTVGVLLACPTLPDAFESTELAAYTSPVIRTETSFNEALLSANVDAPPGAAWCLQLRVRRGDNNPWSPWLHVAEWGPKWPTALCTTESSFGRIDVDYFTSDQRYDHAQFRVLAAAHPLPGGNSPNTAQIRVARADLVLSDTTRRITAVPQPDQRPFPSRTQQLNVPFRSQRAERAELAGRICSPTSVSMVLAYRGVHVPTDAVAAAAFDSVHGIYGNWPHNVQAAYRLGIAGYLDRFGDWASVARLLNRKQPLIISIRAREGELNGAPYRRTNGHLLVLTGFDEDGLVTVNDPAASTPEAGRLRYSREDLEKVWMQARGRAAYVLLPRRREVRPFFLHAAHESIVDVADVDPRIVIDLRYATENNFTKTKLYDVPRCMLRESVALRLKKVQDRLATEGLYLKIYDGYRPRSVQAKLWELVPDPDYVAPPQRGSRHNRGAAVDLTLIDVDGRELPMPTGYDDFTEAAHRDYSGGSAEARANRDKLAAAMEAEGFVGLPTEWWHFDAENWEQYPLADVSLTE